MGHVAVGPGRSLCQREWEPCKVGRCRMQGFGGRERENGQDGSAMMKLANHTRGDQAVFQCLGPSGCVELMGDVGATGQTLLTRL